MSSDGARAFIMKSFLSPRLLDSFVERTVEALPDSLPTCTPDCASLGRAWQQLGLRPGDLVIICMPNGKELIQIGRAHV